MISVIGDCDENDGAVHFSSCAAERSTVAQRAAASPAMIHPPPPMKTDAPPKNHQPTTTDSDTATTARYPQEIVDDINKNETLIYWSLLLLNCSIVWVYYLYAAVQSLSYAVPSQQSASSLSAFLTLATLHSTWPIVIGHLVVQMVFLGGANEPVGRTIRVLAWYTLLVTCSMPTSANGAGIIQTLSMGFFYTALLFAMEVIEWSEMLTSSTIQVWMSMNTPTPGDPVSWHVVVALLFVIGVASALAEAKCYALARLFPSDKTKKFIRAVQIGNVSAGLLNLATVAVGRSIEASVVYMFVGVSIALVVVAGLFFHKLTNLVCIKFLLQQDESEKKNNRTCLPSEKMANVKRIFKLLWAPAVVQFSIFLAMFMVVPGFALDGKE